MALLVLLPFPPVCPTAAPAAPAGFGPGFNIEPTPATSMPPRPNRRRNLLRIRVHARRTPRTSGPARARSRRTWRPPGTSRAWGRATTGRGKRSSVAPPGPEGPRVARSRGRARNTVRPAGGFPLGTDCRGGGAGADRAPSAGSVRFFINWGGNQGATPSRVLAAVCRRGEVDGATIGAFSVHPNATTFDVSAEVAEEFEAKAGRRDPRDPHSMIRRDRGPGGPRRRGSNRGGRRRGYGARRR